MKTKLYVIKSVLFASFLLILFVSCDEYKNAEYTVTFNANGASGTPPESITVKERDYDYAKGDYWDYIDLPDKGNLSYEGKLFYGWNVSANGTGRRYSPGSSFKVTSNVTLYAHWIDDTFPAPTNLSLLFDGLFNLTWDAVEGYENLEDPNNMYLYDGRKFVTYVILRRATNAGSWTTNNFVPFGFSSTSSYKNTRWDISVGGTFEFMVALGIVTAKNNGANFDVVLGRHSNVSASNIVSTNIVGAGNFMPAPTMFSVVVNSATSVTLSWRRATNLNSYPCLGFYVFYKTDGGNWVQENVFIPYNNEADYSSSFRHIYTKTVSPLTTYYFSVAAVYSDGRGELATPISVKTPAPPLTVTGVTATAYSSTCIDISWNKNVEATAYKVYYEKGSSTTKYSAETVVGTTFTHTGLTPDTEYRYSIKPINIDVESYQFSNTAVCRTLTSSSLTDPIFFILTNNSYVPLKTIKINNGENKLVSDLYKDASCQIPLSPGNYSVTVYDTENRQNNFTLEIVNTDVRHIITDSYWPPARLTLRNNYVMAIPSAYLRIKNAGSWGNNLLNNPITTNNSQFLGTFNQGLYEAYAESTQYYRVTSGTAVNGITVTGGVIDGYRPVWYFMPSFTLALDSTLTMPANGWSIFKPE